MSNHGQLPTTDAHTPFRWIWADSAEKTAQTVTVDDISKVGVQEDDGTLYLLQDLTPTWLQIGGSSIDDNTHAVEDSVTDTVTDVVTLRHTTTGTATNGFGTGIALEAEGAGGSAVEIGRLTWEFDGGENGVFGVFTRDNTNTRLDQSILIRKGYGSSGIVDTSAYIGYGGVDLQQGRNSADQTAGSYYTSVLGGKNNKIAAAWAIIVGGYNNLIDTTTEYGFIGNGYSNTLAAGGFGNFIGGGASNTIGSATYGAILLGTNNNIANGPYYSTILNGKQVSATNDAEVVSGNNNPFSVVGASQGKLQVIRSESITHATTAWSVIESGILVPTDGAMVFDILLIGLDTGATNRFGYRIDGVIVNDGGTTTLLNSTVTTLNETIATFDARVVANDTADTLDIEVQDSAGGGGMIRWVASIRTVETIFS